MGALDSQLLRNVEKNGQDLDVVRRQKDKTQVRRSTRGSFYTLVAVFKIGNNYLVILKIMCGVQSHEENQ